MSGRPPFFPQERDYSCVPACLRMVLAYHGVYKSEDDLIYACDCDQQGTGPDGVVEAAKELGFGRTSRDRPGIQELTSIVREGYYPIVWMATEAQQHAVVLIDVHSEFVHVLDPALKQGDRHIPLEVFVEQRELARRLTVIVRL
jgi:ABC-type bacteriocin/lantibiotic exporter with double-glycine peptidase domain